MKPTRPRNLHVLTPRELAENEKAIIHHAKRGNDAARTALLRMVDHQIRPVVRAYRSPP